MNNNDLGSGSVDSVKTKYSLVIFALSLLPRFDHFLNDIIGWLTRLTYPFSLQYILGGGHESTKVSASKTYEARRFVINQMTKQHIEEVKLQRLVN